MIALTASRRTSHNGLRDFGLSVGAYISDGLGRVLLLRRAAGESLAGLFDLPSGRVEGRETIRQALDREVSEETGLQIKAVDSYVNCFDYMLPTEGLVRQLNFIVRVHAYYSITLSHEHDAYIWLSKTEINDPRVDQQLGTLLRGYFG